MPPAGRHPPTWHRENHSASPVENLHYTVMVPACDGGNPSTNRMTLY
ncbi:tail fiber domain protein [Escherichia coli 09BKT076207]|nr:tail fiber domain protein [Escherichia coli 09BKT076207]